MKVRYCDICKRQVEEDDLRLLSISEFTTEKPAMVTKEICVHCKEEFIFFLNEMEGSKEVKEAAEVET